MVFVACSYYVFICIFQALFSFVSNFAHRQGFLVIFGFTPCYQHGKSRVVARAVCYLQIQQFFLTYKIEQKSLFRMKRLFYSIYVRPIIPHTPEKEEGFAGHVPPGGDREGSMGVCMLVCLFSG